MRKGWRNDPQWVAFYEARDLERVKRQIERVKIKHEIEWASAAADEQIRRTRKIGVSI